MTDANLMDADCIHGNVWYDCQECDQCTCEVTKDDNTNSVTITPNPNCTYSGHFQP